MTKGGNMSLSRISGTNAVGIQSLVHAKKLREAKETEVKKLHMRIATLQNEEEKALKRIEQTRVKA